MKFLADENFPGPALEALRRAGWDISSIAVSSPGITDDEVVALCADQRRVLLTFDKDFGELVFRRGLSAATGVVLFRVIPKSPDESAAVALALVGGPSRPGGRLLRRHARSDRVRQMPQNCGREDQGASAI
jgi:predicted nuclease of predicted toxin-antitoxin system